jgi:hypothetical protein
LILAVQMTGQLAKFAALNQEQLDGQLEYDAS